MCIQGREREGRKQRKGNKDEGSETEKYGENKINVDRKEKKKRHCGL